MKIKRFSLGILMLFSIATACNIGSVENLKKPVNTKIAIENDNKFLSEHPDVKKNLDNYKKFNIKLTCMDYCMGQGMSYEYCACGGYCFVVFSNNPDCGSPSTSNATPTPPPPPPPIGLSIDKTIVSTKNASSISFTISAGDNQAWTITSSTGYSNSGTGSQTFSINSDILGSSLQDGIYSFILLSGEQASGVNLSIDNTPPKIKSIQALDNGQVNITAEDPSVNGVSSGIAPSNQVVSVNYGNNKQASLNFSIASLNAKQTNNVLTNGNYSVDIKDNVGNTFKLSKGCVDSTNKWLTDVTKQINEYEKALKQKENKMNQLNSNLNKVITQYNSLVQEDKTLGANLISYESLLSQYEAKKNELVNLDSYDPTEWDSLISSIETLQSQIIIADEKSRQLKNQIQNLSNKATSIKDEINIVVSETEQIKTNLNNISLDGVCISSAATDLLKTVLGPEFVIANNIVNTALLATNMYSGYVVYENQVYSDQQEAKSKDLRERVRLLAKESKKSDKQKANDIPSWSKSIVPEVLKDHPDWKPDAQTKETFKRAGKPVIKGADSEYNKIKKFFEAKNGTR